MTTHEPVLVNHYSDVLCVWAYCAQVRMDEVRRSFDADVALQLRFVSVFGSTAKKIGGGWADRGGFPAYAAHVASIVARFPHVTLHPDAWSRVRPASSSAPHLFLKAVQLLEGPGPSPPGGLLERASWATRTAFFHDARDIGLRSVQLEIAEQLDLPRAAIEAAIDDGRAIAALCEDAEAQQTNKVDGSPTLLFNEGRQRLYGNVGYRVIEANIAELLRAPAAHNASWC